MTAQLKLVNMAYRRLVKPALANGGLPFPIREWIDRSSRYFHTPDGFYAEETEFVHAGAGVPGLWTGIAVPQAGGPDGAPPTPDSNGAVLYLHGGGFVAGSPQSSASLAAVLAAKLSLRASVPEYRLAPEHRFPAACDDVLTTYRALLDLGLEPSKIVIMGDSSGGNLVLGLLTRICTRGLPRPAACVAISPVSDLTYSGESFRLNADSDVVLSIERGDEVNDLYLGDARRDDPLASPRFASFPGCPPVLIHVGSREILLDDARTMAARLREFGTQVTVDEFEECPHAWHHMHGYLPEADTAIDRISAFCRPLLGR